MPVASMAEKRNSPASNQATRSNQAAKRGCKLVYSSKGWLYRTGPTAHLEAQKQRTAQKWTQSKHLVEVSWGVYAVCVPAVTWYRPHTLHRTIDALSYACVDRSNAALWKGMRRAFIAHLKQPTLVVAICGGQYCRYANYFSDIVWWGGRIGIRAFWE